MREAEERMITYRPDIRYEREIKNTVVRKEYGVNEFGSLDTPATNSLYTDSPNVVTQLSPLVQELIEYSPERILGEFTELLELRDTILLPILERLMSDLTDGTEKVRDDITLQDIVDAYEEDFTNYDPIIEKLVRDAIEQIDFIEQQIKEFYDIRDTSDIDATLETLIQEVNRYIEAEERDLAVPTIGTYTQTQVDNMNRVIKDPKYAKINNYEDYLNYLLGLKVEDGSDDVNYSRIADLNMTNYSLSQQIAQMGHMTKLISRIDNKTFDDIVGGTTQESLEFTIMNPQVLSTTRLSTDLEMRRLNRDSIIVVENLERFNTIEARQKVYEVSKEFRDIFNRTRTRAVGLKSGDLPTAAPFVVAINKTNTSAEKQYENTLVDLLSTSITLVMQMQSLAQIADDKKTNSLLYRMVSLVEKEFDFEYTDKELSSFAARHNLASMK